MRKNKYNKNMNLIYNNAYKTHNYKQNFLKDKLMMKNYKKK